MGKRPRKTRTPGEYLRAVREQATLSLRDVHIKSIPIASKYRNPAFLIPVSRLHDIEVKGVLPTIYRAYTLSQVYECDFSEILALYGIPVSR
jgi:hypothetical protein